MQYYTACFCFSLAGLSRLTGIHQGQLSHYVNGTRKPSRQTIRKIGASIHSFADNVVWKLCRT
ncbi:MAG: helix-turn-helix transcriptional regulator [Bacteroidales bacterium]|nr:helix-turn-helix transcriptional regulator [Bacteroidales bacterium]